MRTTFEVLLGECEPDPSSYLTGWKLYFQLAETPNVFRELDKSLRHRLRAAQLKQWKRGWTTYRALRDRELSDKAARQGAAHVHRWWAAASHPAFTVALPISYFDRLGVPRLAGR